MRNEKQHSDIRGNRKRMCVSSSSDKFLKLYPGREKTRVRFVEGNKDSTVAISKSPPPRETRTISSGKLFIFDFHLVGHYRLSQIHRVFIDIISTIVFKTIWDPGYLDLDKCMHYPTYTLERMIRQTLVTHRRTVALYHLGKFQNLMSHPLLILVAVQYSTVPSGIRKKLKVHVVD